MSAEERISLPELRQRVQEAGTVEELREILLGMLVWIEDMDDTLTDLDGLNLDDVAERSELAEEHEALLKRVREALA